jgi:hypothetical protein
MIVLVFFTNRKMVVLVLKILKMITLIFLQTKKIIALVVEQKLAPTPTFEK